MIKNARTVLMGIDRGNIASIMFAGNNAGRRLFHEIHTRADENETRGTRERERETLRRARHPFFRFDTRFHLMCENEFPANAIDLSPREVFPLSTHSFSFCLGAITRFFPSTRIIRFSFDQLIDEITNSNLDDSNASDKAFWVRVFFSHRLFLNLHE